jgi:hypothetical protein
MPHAVHAVAHTYRSQGWSRFPPLPELLAAAIWFGGPVVFLFSCIAARSWWAFAGVAAGSIAWMWPVGNDLFRRCDEVTLTETGVCEFRSGLRRIRVWTARIESVSRARIQYNERSYALVRYQGGKLWVMQPVDGWEDFLARLLQLNPLVVVWDYEVAGSSALKPEYRPAL